MTSQLRKNKKRAAPNDGDREGDNRESDEPECPVCLNPLEYGRELTRHNTRNGSRQLPVTWPCGHTVCGACDKRMIETNHYRCAVCRTLREGFSNEYADLAARVRTLADAAYDAQRDGGTGVGVGTQVQHGGRQFQVIFFANQSVGDPFAALTQASEHAARNEGGVGIVRTGEIETAEADADGRPGRLVRARHVGDVDPAVPAAMAGLIQEMLRPTSIEAFLAQREQTVNSLNTRNTLNTSNSHGPRIRDTRRNNSRVE